MFKVARKPFKKQNKISNELLILISQKRTLYSFCKALFKFHGSITLTKKKKQTNRTLHTRHGLIVFPSLYDTTDIKNLYLLDLNLNTNYISLNIIC